MPLTPEGSKVIVTDITITALSYEVIPEAPAEAKGGKADHATGARAARRNSKNLLLLLIAPAPEISERIGQQSGGALVGRFVLR